jgi:predicted HicB family RNase H-like nuclease
MARRRKDADATDATPEASPPPDQVNVKIERALHRKLKLLATSEGSELTAYVDKVLREHAATEWPRFLREQS